MKGEGGLKRKVEVVEEILKLRLIAMNFLQRHSATTHKQPTQEPDLFRFDWRPEVKQTARIPCHDAKGRGRGGVGRGGTVPQHAETAWSST
eukprot:4295848-Pyramimonas_sp.AAC.1